MNPKREGFMRRSQIYTYWRLQEMTIQRANNYRMNQTQVVVCHPALIQQEETTE